LPNAEGKETVSKTPNAAIDASHDFEARQQQARKVWNERSALSPVQQQYQQQHYQQQQYQQHQDQEVRQGMASAYSESHTNQYQHQYQQQQHTQQHREEIYERRENLSFPELDDSSSVHRPALPPKTKIMNSPSRNIFSPTGSDRGGDDSCASTTTNTTASVKTVEFLPVREKVKLIAAQQEELCRREQEADPDAKRPKGVRILPPSPITVRKMSVEEELYQYDKVVTRTTPVTQVMELEDNRTGFLDSPVPYTLEKVEKDSKKQEGLWQESSATVLRSNNDMKASSKSYSANQQTFASASTAQWSGVQTAGITVPGWTGEQAAELSNAGALQQRLDQAAQSQEINSALDRLIAEAELTCCGPQQFLILWYHQQHSLALW
jgi:hypothetical protein